MDPGIFSRNSYYKRYETGSLAGQLIEIPKDEFSGWREEAQLLWGKLDWKGDWVPGLLRPELQRQSDLDPCAGERYCT